MNLLMEKMGPLNTRESGESSASANATAELSAAMCANGLLRIQDILRPRGVGGSGPDSLLNNNNSSNNPMNHLSQLHHHFNNQHHHGHHHQHPLANHHQHNHLHHQQNHQFQQFQGGMMFPMMLGGLKTSPISPPIGADQSPPATPPLSLHSPDILHHSSGNKESNSKSKDREDKNQGDSDCKGEIHF
jgi:hypothetical protein